MSASAVSLSGASTSRNPCARRRTPVALDGVPRLETERFWLRGLSASDFETEAAFYGSERASFVGGPVGREDAWRKFAAAIGHWALRGFGYWAVEDKANGAYLGRVGLWEPEGWPEPELGWMVMGPAEGRGVAHEAAVRIRDFAYRSLGWPPLISTIDSDNTRSIALAERLGARREGEVDLGEWGVIDVYRHPSAQDLAARGEA